MIDDPVLVHDWHPVATTEQVDSQVPLGARLLGEDLVLWRADGKTLAWQDLCLHRGTRLSLGKVVEHDELECPYHGWTYNAEGRCVRIPAHPERKPPTRAQVKTYQARERYGLIWVSLGQPQHEIPPFPEWDDSDYRKIFCGPYPVRASGPRIVENFLDVGHFPYVHEGILGVRERPEIEDYESTIGPDGVVSKGVRVYQPDPYGTGEGDTVAYTYRAFRPLTAYFIKESEESGFSILLTVTPHEATDSTAWLWMAMNYGHELPEQDLREYQDKIFSQDRPIVQSQRPELLPLDLQAELHLRSDRTAIAYRKWLKELGLTFGTS
jgi:phenylpropionate dioxygenase-like ring-hydroxylating dioxygenase large terminal subunit